MNEDQNKQSAIEFYHQGSKFASINDFEKALEYHQKAVDLFPEYEDALADLGADYYMMKDYDNALLNFDKALTLNPNLGKVWYNKGQILMEKGLLLGAVICYKEAKKINPDDKYATSNYQYIMNELSIRDMGNEEGLENQIQLISKPLPSFDLNELIIEIKEKHRSSIIMSFVFGQNKYVDFAGARILEKEALALHEIEEYTNDRKFQVKSRIGLKDNKPQFTIKRGKVNAIGLYDNGLQALPESIGNFTLLEMLNLSKNSLKELPQSIKNLVILKDLNLSENSFNELPKPIFNLHFLKYLHIDNNSPQMSLSSTILNLLSLKILSLTKNKDFTKETKDLIKKLKKRKVKILFNNKPYEPIRPMKSTTSYSSFKYTSPFEQMSSFLVAIKQKNYKTALAYYEQSYKLRNLLKTSNTDIKSNLLEMIKNQEINERYQRIEGKLKKVESELIYEGEYEDIVKMCDDVIFFENFNPIAWYWKGKALTALGRDEEAFECFENALGLPNFGLIMNSITVSSTLLSGGKEKINLRKTEFSEKSIPLFPGAKIWSQSGAYTQTFGQFEAALYCYEKALDINPNYQPALRNKKRVIQLLKSEGLR